MPADFLRDTYSRAKEEVKYHLVWIESRSDHFMIFNARDTGWRADICCEGGPVIVANLEDFVQWRGAEPFDPSQATELHHWGQFTAELPEEWRPNGVAGHQYIAANDPYRACQDLIGLVLAHWPGSVIEQHGMAWRVTRTDGRFMNLALEPGSEYDRAIRAFGSEAVHTFGQGARAYLWDAAPGPVRIHVDASRTRLLLAQVEFSDDEADAEEAYAHALAADTAPAETALRYRVTQGPLVAAWAPNSASDLAQAIAPGDAGPDRPGKLLDLAIAESGVLFWLEPGWYASSPGYHEAGSWGVSWCELRRP